MPTARLLFAALLPILLATQAPFAQPYVEDSPLETHALIPRMMEAYRVPGLAVVVVSGNEVLVARGYGEQADGAPFTAQTPVGLYSATKALSSLVYAGLARDGRIDLDAALGTLLPEAPESWAEIPFYRLLNHTSGIAMVQHTPEFAALMDSAATNASVYRMVRDRPLDFETGTATRYQQSGFAIAEMIVEQDLETTWPELVAEYVTEPAGATATVYGSSLAVGPAFLRSAGFYQTTSADMGRLFLALNAGRIVAPSRSANSSTESPKRSESRASATSSRPSAGCGRSATEAAERGRRSATPRASGSAWPSLRTPRTAATSRSRSPTCFSER